MKTENIFPNIVRIVLTTVFVIAVTCFLIIQFVDLPFVPTWSRIYGSDSEFDTESDSVTFLNVGEGDSILIRSNGRFVLIDTGDGESVDIVRKLKGYGVTTIDALVLTHWHSDHIGGAVSVAEKFNVLNVVAPALPDINNETYKNAVEVYDNLRSQNVDFTYAVVGMRINVGDFKLSVLYSDRTNAEENDRSVVMMANCRNKKFLLMSDAEFLTEAELISESINLDCDVIKIGHHGSKNSTSDDLIEAASPQYAVISVGVKNKYGHPSDTVLNKLIYKDILIYRTDRLGDVKFLVEEEEIAVYEGNS
ncbi:MAG: ComEC/Rec2 family competence protein [Acutalibacteraceae bacterium]|nr:ComEC/Rec2 family competence protein [Acutalibacteraceae bacterium]